MDNRFYVDTDEEITSIVGKIRGAKEREIFLIVPKGASIAQSLVNLKLLDKEAKRNGKGLIFISSDEHVRKLANKAGLAVKKSLSSSTTQGTDTVKNVSDIGKAVKSQMPSTPQGEKLKKELENAVIDLAGAAKAVPKTPPVPPKKVNVGSFDIASRMAEKKKKALSEESKITPKEEAVVVKKKALPKPKVIPKPQEEAFVNPFKIKPLKLDTELEEKPVETEKVPTPPAIPPIEPEPPKTPPVSPPVKTPPIPTLSDIPPTSKEPDSLVEREKIKEIDTQSKGIIRGRTAKEKPKLDLVSYGERGVYSEKPLIEKYGILETTRRKVGGKSQVVDLRSVGEEPEISEKAGALRIQRVQKEKKEIVLLPLFNTKLFFTFILGIAVVLAILGGIVLPSAKVEVKPRTFKTEAEVKVVVSEEISEIDFDEKVIPGKSVRFKLNKEKTFQTTSQGEVQEKARGQVKVYNNSETELNLRSNAKLETSKDNVYYTITSVLVPPAVTGSDGVSLESGTANVEIISAVAGSDYNLSSGKLTFPNLDGREYVGSVWAEVINITGGASRTTKVVSAEDLTNAKNELTEIVKSEGNTQISSYLETGYIVDNNSMFIEDLSFTSSQLEGREAEEFKGSIEANIFAMSFREDDLKLIGKKIIEAEEEKERGKVEIQNFIMTEAKPVENRAELSANLTYTLRSNVDIDNIRKSITANSEQEAVEYLLGLREIEDYRLEIWPSWTKRIPVLDKRIKVEIVD